MKKVIALLVCLLSAPAFADANFGHWSANSENISVFAKLENGSEVGVMVFHTGSVMIGISPTAKPMGKEIHSEESEVVINGQPVKATVMWHDCGGILIDPITTRGNNFITGQLWSKKQVTIKFKEFEFWVTAQGVQKAWNYLKATKQAI